MAQGTLTLVFQKFIAVNFLPVRGMGWQEMAQITLNAGKSSSEIRGVTGLTKIPVFYKFLAMLNDPIGSMNFG